VNTRISRQISQSTLNKASCAQLNATKKAIDFKMKCTGELTRHCLCFPPTH